MKTIGLWAIALGMAAFVWACGGGDTSAPQLEVLDLGADGAADAAGGPAEVDARAVEGPSVEAMEETHMDEGPAEDVGLAEEGLMDVETCKEGAPCDDKDPCTYMDQCVGGVCAGKPYTCADGRPCTDDVCDGYGGCKFPIKQGYCLIANVCYEAGKAAATNACAVCDPANSQVSFSMALDHTPCGQDDLCLEEGECIGGQCTAAPKGCDDENPCTDDKCVPGQGCVHIPNHDPCEDGDPCTLGDQCQDGECKTGFLPLDCWDGNPCTADLCTPSGCEHPPVVAPCDDGDVCTEGDQCQGGQCVPGEPVVCDDGNDCTTESCVPGEGCKYTIVNSPCCSKLGANICDDKNPCTRDICNPADGSCTHEPWTGACNDGDLCTGPDVCGEDGVCKGPPKDCDDHNTCTTDACDPKKGCVHTVVSGPCDDGSLCTTDDFCLPNGVCGGKPVSCDDKNPCTKDSCAPATGCVHEPTNGPCNDGNACTENDNCATGKCVGTPVNCDDKNQCTADSCHPASGCQHTQVAGPCDDGKSCTENDHCEAGVCVGTPVGLCCTPEWTAPVDAVYSLELGASGQPGEGLDVDGKASTCSPTDNCSGGIDNSMSVLAPVANPELKKALQKGDVVVLFEHRGFNTNGTPYMLAFWGGAPVNKGCDPSQQSCAYLVDPVMMNQECKPMYGFNNAKVVGNKLTAGGVGYNWPLDIPVTGGTMIHLTVANAQIQATLTISSGKPVAMEGVLAGAVPKASIVDAIKAIPDDQLPPGLTKDMLIGMLDMLIKNDIDTDGDKNLDAASVGVKFKAAGASIAGLKP